MTVHEFGKDSEDVIVLFHPLGARWDVFEYVVPILEKDYHLVIPALPGFDPDAPHTDFTGVEEIAADITAWLAARGYEHVKCLYGCSMGGGIVARMLAEKTIRSDCAVMDGGMTPYQLWKPLTYLIGARDFCVMELGKHLSVGALRGMFDPEKYNDDDLQYVKTALSAMSIRTIWRSTYSCNNYSMPRPIPQPDCTVQYWYGTDEKKARKWDIDYIRKAFPAVELVENANQGHAEFFTLHPEAFCEQLMTLIRKTERKCV